MSLTTTSLLTAARLALAWEEGVDCGRLTVTELCDQLRAAIAEAEGTAGGTAGGAAQGTVEGTACPQGTCPPEPCGTCQGSAWGHRAAQDAPLAHRIDQLCQHVEGLGTHLRAAVQSLSALEQATDAVAEHEP